MKTAIVTDSTAYLTEAMLKNNNIYRIPLNVIMNGESFQEEIELTADDFYDKVRDADELPKTSQPAIGEFTKLYEEIAQSYDAVISIHLSSAISGTYQAAITAGDMIENLEVYVFDSEISCMPQGMLVLAAAKKAQAGIHPQEIVQQLHKLRQHTKAYFIVEDLKHLQKGGRLTGAQALVGSMLQIKPVLHFVDKKIVPYEKIRTRKRAKARIMQKLSESLEREGNATITIIHANRLEEANELKQEIEREYPSASVFISYFGAVIGTHLGEGALGIGWCPVALTE
ncbi:DegV family protein [Bacillaceae bacterium SIJ1]|uniref:DegV family protein n=1 Tax=Litoribacterium kuwaitense TaxID=1398745 RepID=UPI0013EA40BF|nr:DegV family protein [Litoribacterium kuwaitense]NGP44946.1 DegV family protein [Litoribacterium kuwaitense]